MTALIKERPIIFGAESVRGILAGRKTKTRRVVKHQKAAARCRDGEQIAGRFRCPHGKPGDRLWVKEQFAEVPGIGEADDWVDYRATPKFPESDQPGGGDFAKGDPDRIAWRSPLFMPRWASRLTLELTGVRVERLQDISEADIEAEVDLDAFQFYGTPGIYDLREQGTTRREERVFEWLWERIHGPGSWAANPWVWVESFKRVRP